MKRKLILIASLCTILMAIPHFFIPFIFPWKDKIDGLYEPIVWALFAMNFFFSLLLLYGGILTLIVNKKDDLDPKMKKIIIYGMGSFWFFGGIYEIIVPFPYVVANIILPVIAFIIAGLYFSHFYIKEKNR